MGFYCYFEILFYFVCVTIIPPYSADQLTSSNNNTETQFPLATICSKIVNNYLLQKSKDGKIYNRILAEAGNKFDLCELRTHAVNNINVNYFDLVFIYQLVYNIFVQYESSLKIALSMYDPSNIGIVTIMAASQATSKNKLFGKKLLKNSITNILNQYKPEENKLNYQDIVEKITKEFGSQF
ncbi:uncharacterized protein LOC126902760 [Daktulosphaira vitifoliae]|uniref:uncharacterized protein LOC126902760 n=1 Tax=Daktulosphaira vitifoliae TaxID=58002 RepID=UPI0021A9C2E2|nr:uncharacterized protein LOC126902760 [Daktulosphaira vitifoliae]